MTKTMGRSRENVSRSTAIASCSWPVAAPTADGAADAAGTAGSVPGAASSGRSATSAARPGPTASSTRSAPTSATSVRSAVLTGAYGAATLPRSTH